MSNKKRPRIIALLLCLILALSACSVPNDFISSSIVEKASGAIDRAMADVWEQEATPSNDSVVQTQANSVDLDSIPAFDGTTPYVPVEDNIPDFSDIGTTTTAYEQYSDLDELGRCGVCYGCMGQELMPTEERESISDIYPSGWVQAQYDFVDGKFLYNRSHLIGFQIAGENANEKNLITGTRFFNVNGMLPFENMVADYIRETGNHVMYRVTPVYDGNNLVCNGLRMEAYSVEDEGDGVCFDVYVYNAQPGVEIDYATGESWATGDDVADTYDPFFDAA